jgi:hypothetical protein
MASATSTGSGRSSAALLAFQLRSVPFTTFAYFALGGRSNPDYFGRMADRLAAIFPDFTIETFLDRHHFDGEWARRRVRGAGGADRDGYG